MFDFLMQHQFWAAAGIYWIFSAAVSSMPEPGAGGSPGYLWLYRFLHTIAGNITTAVAGRLPGLKILVALVLAPLAFSMTACARHYTIHPGALNMADSAAYDALLTAQAVIDEARSNYERRQLPAGAKELLDTLIHSYNVARNSWLAYRSAIAEKASSNPDFTELNKNLSDLANAVRALKEVRK